MSRAAAREILQLPGPRSTTFPSPRFRLRDRRPSVQILLPPGPSAIENMRSGIGCHPGYTILALCAMLHVEHWTWSEEYVDFGIRHHAIPPADSS